MRYRHSVRLAPGIRWNFSGSGSSWTFGPRGASVNVGERGTFLNTGIPGTGFYDRARLDRPPATSAASRSPTKVQVEMTCEVLDDGTMTFVYLDGRPVPEHIIEIAKKQAKDKIRELIQATVDKLNDQVEGLGRLHHDTLNPSVKPRYEAAKFPEPEPIAPTPREPTFWQRLFGKATLIRAANEETRQRYEAERDDWLEHKDVHQKSEKQRRKLIEVDILSDVAAMERFLEGSLQDIAWPRETSVSFDIRHDGTEVLIDVDLPEIEDMPTKVAAAPARGLKMSVKDMPASKVHKLYLEHVHGIIFRLVGEVFSALPTVDRVLASGFTQRPDPATGVVRDDYVLSVRVGREQWQALNFANPELIDVVEALGRFEIARNPQRSGKLLTITPLV